MKTDSPEASIIDSNILDPKMFDDNSCGSKISSRKGKIRSIPEIYFREGAKKKYISKVYNDVNSTSDERKLLRVRAKMKRY